jgi:uncharacterized protein YjiS (DUF1127 family)
MNALTAKDDMSMMRPAALSHYFKDEALHQQAPERQPVGLRARIAGLFRFIAELPRRQSVLFELNALSDHELSDIGLVRTDLSRVFEPEFYNSRNGERGATAAATQG